MPKYRIHRLRESARQPFRWAPHTSGVALVKPKEYEPAGEVEAATPYAAWAERRNTDAALQLGDLLEGEDGTLRICKYIGFEAAQWLLPEPKPVPDATATAPVTP